MQKIFYEVSSLDQRCYETFALTEDLLMEHAAGAMQNYIKAHFTKGSTILIVCGVGNNGADGIALARLLLHEYDVKIYLPFELKSKMAKLQYERLNKLGLKSIGYICSCDVLVDCLFGSGLTRPLNHQAIELIATMNRLDAFKLACDIPSGLNAQGEFESIFSANATITMGALKLSLFADDAKDHIGELHVANLGLARELYETSSDLHLLEKEDLKVPLREKQSSHKGDFGHAAIIVGEKKGAGILAAHASFAFGSGLVTLIAHEPLNVDHHLMQCHRLPDNTTAIALGMGLGKFEAKEIKTFLSHPCKKVIDADLFYQKLLIEFLNQELVLTPHPKEFVSLLKLTGLAKLTVKELQNNRAHYALLFSKAYPKTTLLLKGANTMIAQGKKLYINPYGTPALSKGGSGDVLTGLICALLAQGQSCIDAAIHASLAHAQASLNFKKNNYALQPQDLIEEVKQL